MSNLSRVVSEPEAMDVEANRMEIEQNLQEQEAPFTVIQQEDASSSSLSTESVEAEEQKGRLRVDSDADAMSERAATSSQNSSRDWGWFEHEDLTANKTPSKPKQKTLVPSNSSSSVNLIKEIHEHPMAVTAPTYVLEESLSTQKLWKQTAGQRPPQPAEERAFFEKMWAQNFERSQVNYSLPVEVLTATSPINLSPFEGNFAQTNNISDYNLAGKDGGQEAHFLPDEHPEIVNKTVKGSEGDLTVLVKGDNVFGTTVSKSFTNDMGNVVTVNISIASYRVVESKNHGKYAQFLVIYREGSIRDTVGVWKRYSDFEELARTVTQAHEGCASVIASMSPLAVTEESETEHLPNAVTSWRLLKKRKRWYRCLDAGYLSLKVFLLERFLHDILFESTSPNLMRQFVLNKANEAS